MVKYSDWQDDYKRKLVTVEEAISIVKSGNRVALSTASDGEPQALCEALAARFGELKDVEIHIGYPVTDFGWYQPGWEESFKVALVNYSSALGRQMMQKGIGDYIPLLYSLQGKPESEGRPGVKSTDVFLTRVTPPDKHGFCCFGPALWSKRWYSRSARTVIAEVDKTLIRTYGDSLIHVSEIDYFVEHISPPPQFIPPETKEYMRAIGHYVGTLVKDGDTIAIGAGEIGRNLVSQGIFDNKHDLGYFAENLVPGIVRLVKEGIVTGKNKTRHQGKVVCNNFLHGDSFRHPEELAFIDNNPVFELYPQEYVVNIRTVADHDNIVAINGTLAVDLTGQIASESVGPAMFAGAGGQPSFAIGSVLAKGGRSIIVLPSTTSDGKTSRIVPFFLPGTIVTVPRTFADYVVTEYGIASLLGKSQRQRAQELIAIAHPDFRQEIQKQVQKLL